MNSLFKVFTSVLLMLFIANINSMFILAMPGAAPVFVPEPKQTQAGGTRMPGVKQGSASSLTKTSAQDKSKEGQEQKTEKEEERKDIYLNFENTELLNFINYMADQKKLNLIPDKALEGVKISLTIRDPLTVDGAWNIFLTVIEMAGFSIIKVGDVHKVIPKDQKLRQPLPAYINVPSDTLPDSDLVIRYVVFLNNLNVESVQPLLESMLSDVRDIIAQPEVNGFIITDKSYNIKSAIKLIQELDKTGQAETVVVMKLKNANAEDVKQLLEALIKKPDVGGLARLLGRGAEGTKEYFPPGARIISEPRTNALILLGPVEPIKKIEQFVTTYVDTELKATESPLHIYELQYTDAEQIKGILEEVTAPPDSGPGEQAGKYGAIRGGVKYFKSMRFKVDKEGNRLIVSSTDKEDWRLLKKTIEDLDKPQPQVAVEALFVSISAKDLKELGGTVRNKKHGQIGRNIDFQSAPLSGAPTFEPDDENPLSLLGNLLLGQIGPQKGMSVFSIGKQNNIWAVFKAVKEQTNTSILSQPFITIANKSKGIIEVGSEKRVPQDQTEGGLTGYTSVSASTKVEIEPQINLDGIIRLKININISDFTSPDGSSTEKKELMTDVTVADGQVLVLGGFVSTKVTEAKVKTPLLSDIPVLGWLFKKQNRTIDKNYIFVFMSPTIIKPRQQPGIGLYSKMKLHQATDQLESGVITTKTPDPIFNWFFNPDKENY